MYPEYEQIEGSEVFGATVATPALNTVNSQAALASYAGVAVGLYLSAISGNLYVTKRGTLTGGVVIPQGTGATFFGNLRALKWTSDTGTTTYYATLLSRVP